MDAFADLTCGGSLKFGAADAEAMALFKRRASGGGAGEGWKRGGSAAPPHAAQPSAAQRKRLTGASLSLSLPFQAPPPSSRT